VSDIRPFTALAAERGRRSAIGKAGAETRWMLAHAERNANAMLTQCDLDAIGMQAETSLAEPSRVTPKPPQAGARPRSRRKSGDTPRARGANPRLLREGDEAKDAKIMAELAERTARWNAAHPSDPVGSIVAGKP
jgi:hypothetical protein